MHHKEEVPVTAAHDRRGTNGRPSHGYGVDGGRRHIGHPGVAPIQPAVLGGFGRGRRSMGATPGRGPERPGQSTTHVTASARISAAGGTARASSTCSTSSSWGFSGGAGGTSSDASASASAAVATTSPMFPWAPARDVTPPRGPHRGMVDVATSPLVVRSATALPRTTPAGGQEMSPAAVVTTMPAAAPCPTAGPSSVGPRWPQAETPATTRQHRQQQPPARPEGAESGTQAATPAAEGRPRVQLTPEEAKQRNYLKRQKRRLMRQSDPGRLGAAGPGAR